MKIKTIQKLEECRCATCRRWSPVIVTERQAVGLIAAGLVIVAAVIGAYAAK